MWRKTYNAVVINPRRFGIPWDGAIFEDLQLSMDKTLLQDVPKFAGAYSNKRRVVAGPNNKRQQTVCQVLNLSGKVLVWQVIICGKSKMCLVQGDAIDPNIVQMYAEKMTQTGATFIALLHRIESRLKATKRALVPPLYALSIVLMNSLPQQRVL